ncbi:V-type ATPase subunit [candidate division WOR-3 bacterium]|nr:V-type ATPase subunit [candidate division WOR-3 bacterium]
MDRLSEDSKYGFAIGRVRALEPTLMDRPRYERFVRARGGDEFAAALAETAYGRFLEGGAAGVPEALGGAARDNSDFFSAYALDGWLTRLFSLPTAFRRLKAAAKEALSQGKGDAELPQEIRDLPEGRQVAKVVADTIQTFSQERDPAAVDAALDRLQQQAELRVASASQFVTGYFGLHADIENLRTVVRLKAREGADKDLAGEMEAAFLEGGTLTLATLLAALPQPWEAMLELLAKAPPLGAGSEKFRAYLEQGRAALTSRRSFARMERIGREAELRYLRQTRYATFGYEPLVTFFLLRENEVRNLRLIYAAKLAGRAIEETQDLVAYVE